MQKPAFNKDRQAQAATHLLVFVNPRNLLELNEHMAFFFPGMVGNASLQQGSSR